MSMAHPDRSLESTDRLWKCPTRIGDNTTMAGSQGAYRGSSIEWTADDLRRALLRRAHFRRAGRRWRRSGGVLSHAGVARRAIRRLGLRAAAALVRGGNPSIATALVTRLSSGSYHDEQM